MNNIDLLMRSLPLLVKGTTMTLCVLLGASFFSLLLGFLFGVILSDRMRIQGISWIVAKVTFVLRAVPFYVQLLIVYFVLPDLCGYNLDPFSASVLSLGFCSAGYVAQIVSGGINAIPHSQWEVSSTLGLSSLQTLRWIIFPQMLRNVLPALNNEIESLLKSTAVVSSIGLLELTRAGMNVVSREMTPVPIYLMIALFYLILSMGVRFVAQKLEKKVAYVVN